MSQSRPTLFNYNFDSKPPENDAKVEDVYAKLGKAKATQKHNSESPLFTAVENGDLETLKTLLQAPDAYVDVKGDNIATPLHCVAAKGNVAIIQYLIDMGANVNAQNCHGLTPLHFTLSNKKTDAAKVLIDKGANPHIRSSPLKSATALEWAQGVHGTYLGDSDYKNEEVADYIVKNYRHKGKYQ